MALCIAPPSGSCEGKEEDKSTIQRDFVIEDNGRLTAYHGPGGEVTIPEGVLKIGEGAFAGCVRLKEAMLPEGLTDMGRLAFYGCEGLLQAEIPGSLRELASSVFGDCVSLKRIVLHEGLEAVSIYAFSNCRSLSELELPRGLASVGYGSFQGCAGLTRLTIPKDTRLEFDGRTVPHQTTPFADSVSLTDIQVDGENPYYEAQDGGLYEKRLRQSDFLVWDGGEGGDSRLCVKACGGSL